MDPTQRNSAQCVAIAGIRLIATDITRSTAFFSALGFKAIAPGRLEFGTTILELVTAAGAAYPEPAQANDPWFQHFAIAVADMAAAASIALAAGAMPITRNGPQLLPPNTGNVTAWKFRDLDGHPLELSLIPGSAWLRDAPPDTVFLGVDHTAIAVAELGSSRAWYEALGFRETSRSRNRGNEQDRLDGLSGVVVDIVALAPPGAGPHLELLCYQTPRPAAPRKVDVNDVAATVTLLTAGDPSIDPDGHRIDCVTATATNT